ncbi:hypothetical protein [Psychromarinibacter sp. S121]|uniref:hypothetical protein n=1 Tax=Psychromarinibacter sp. S121 TaxID=3415127 RepID=UPI003C7B79ED
MVDQNFQRDREYIRETDKSGGGMSVMAFIVGGLVVLVGILAFVFWGDVEGSFGGATTGGGDVSVTVESEASGDAAATDSAADPAPAETAAPDAAASADAEAESGN